MHVSYRDSKLTRFCSPLSGEAQMSVICCVTPSAKFIEQTLCTLQFASRCRLVTTSPVINEEETSASAVLRLQKELTLLRGEKKSQLYGQATRGGDCSLPEAAWFSHTGGERAGPSDSQQSDHHAQPEHWWYCRVVCLRWR